MSPRVMKPRDIAGNIEEEEEHRLFLTWQGGVQAALFLYSSLIQALNAVQLWFVLGGSFYMRTPLPSFDSDLKCKF